MSESRFKLYARITIFSLQAPRKISPLEVSVFKMKSGFTLALWMMAACS